MSGLMSKRQQARNEKVLQELVQSVPGNNVCADCTARNPSWASWNLGIFLCMRCAAIHRKLGTHISKVKSLSMDSWTNEQVDNMKKTGNAASNRQWNPKSKQPPVPVDADEADGAMERFIRAKYTQKSSGGGARRHTGRSSDSDEGTPPPLPPKTGGRFGFAKPNSSTFPLSFRSTKKESRSTPGSPRDFPSEDSPNHLSNKPSKVFGANVQPELPDATAAKLAQLRDMGFMDDKRNAMILKGVNGNVEKTIEALVRLGEGAGHSSVPPRVPSRDSSLPLPPKSLTPQQSFDVAPGVTGKKESPVTPNHNPWDVQPAQPQSSQSTGTIQNHSNPFYSNTTVNTNDPFGLGDVGGQHNLAHSMQNLSLAPPAQQALFPHHTGGVPGPQATVATMGQQSMTPPGLHMQHFPSQLSQQSPQGYNPFLQPSPSQQMQPISLNASSPFQTQSQSQPGTPLSHVGNPFMRSPSQMASPSPLNQIPEQSQQNTYNSPQSAYGNNPFMGMPQFPANTAVMQQNPYQTSQQQNPFQAQAQQNPYQSAMQQQQPQQQQPQQQQQQNPWQSSMMQQQQNLYQTQQNYYQPQQHFGQPQMMGSYQPPVDKASIMALYGSTNSTMSPFSTQNSQQQHQQVPQQQQQQQQQPQQQQQQQQQNSMPQRSVSVPLSGTSNPFLGGGLAQKAGLGSVSATTTPPVNPAPVTIGAMGGARSRESIMVEMGWSNGRHSPDAFASFSARG